METKEALEREAMCILGLQVELSKKILILKQGGCPEGMKMLADEIAERSVALRQRVREIR